MAQGSSNPTTDVKKVGGTAVDTNTGNASAGTQRVVLATNQPVIPISDNGGSITVDGTFWQATQPVSGPLTDAQLRATAVPVSLASVPSHAVTNAGTFAVQVDGAALTALQLLDNAVATDGSTAVTGMFQVGGTDGTNAQILSTNTSGHVNIADGGNSITVDGTFWQATQPVSGPLTNTELRAAAVPISGTIELGSTSLAALENISVTIPGTVDLGTVSLTALETITVTQSNAANFLATATQSLGSAATRWYTQISDGSNSPSIKAASTAAVAGDPALVVAISPNNTVGLSAGTNAIGKLAANDGVDIGDVSIMHHLQ
jgi:hypothetical protein